MFAETCRITLDLFEGPLDLLLYLIRREELDIYDVPVAVVADQYLDYIRKAQELDLEIAGEYLVMASTLTWLKSRSMLPGRRDGTDEDEDPRAALIRQLVMYRAFKDVAEELRTMENVWRDSFAPPGERGRWTTDKVQVTPGQAGILDLVETLETLMFDQLPPPPQRVQKPDLTIPDCIEDIHVRLEAGEMLSLLEIAGAAPDRYRVVCYFVTVLELARRGWVRLHQDSPFAKLLIERTGGWV